MLKVMNEWCVDEVEVVVTARRKHPKQVPTIRFEEAFRSQLDYFVAMSPGFPKKAYVPVDMYDSMMNAARDKQPAFLSGLPMSLLTYDRIEIYPSEHLAGTEVDFVL
jgi:hypothetical protein